MEEAMSRTVTDLLREVGLTKRDVPLRPQPNFERIRDALVRGERDCILLDGRNFDRQYWINAKAALGRIERQLQVAEGERDALREVWESVR
jgi:hypothetical protein